MIETSTFLAAWGAFFAGHISLRNLPETVKEGLKSEIDSFNSSKGLGQSISAEELSKEYLAPFKNSKIAEYCRSEGKDLDNYVRELQEQIGTSFYYSIKYYIYYLSSLVFFPGVFITLFWNTYQIYYLALCMVFVATELFFWLTE